MTLIRDKATMIKRQARTVYVVYLFAVTPQDLLEMRCKYQAKVDAMLDYGMAAAKALYSTP